MQNVASSHRWILLLVTTNNRLRHYVLELGKGKMDGKPPVILWIRINNSTRKLQANTVATLWILKRSDLYCSENAECKCICWGRSLWAAKQSSPGNWRTQSAFYSFSFVSPFSIHWHNHLFHIYTSTLFTNLENKNASLCHCTAHKPR